MNRFYARVVLLSVFCVLTVSLSAFSLSSWTSKFVICDPFEAIIGMKEQHFFNEYGFSEEGKNFLNEKLQGKQGTFYVKQVEPFRVKTLTTPRELQKPTLIFSIVEGGENPTGKSFQKNVDVTALQAASENNGAVFQVASNLSCLESSGTKQERISHYCGARAQGQLCALSALPGTIDRMYLQPPINLLTHFKWQGPIAYDSGKFPRVPKFGDRFYAMSYDDICRAAETMSVGVQKNVCVTSGLRDFSNGAFTAVPVQGTDQCITQVFTAALDPYNNDEKNFAFRNLARVLLHGAYKGTFDVVREVGAKKLFLTMVGGGVFQNKYEWIAEAIRAACGDFHVYGFHAPLQVTLVLYYIPPVDKQEEDWKNAEKILKHLVSQPGGTWTRYGTKGIKKIV